METLKIFYIASLMVSLSIMAFVIRKEKVITVKDFLIMIFILIIPIINISIFTFALIKYDLSRSESLIYKFLLFVNKVLSIKIKK